MRVDAFVTGRNPNDAPGIVVQRLGRGETRQNVASESLGLLREPSAKLPQAHDVIAVVMQRPRHHERRHPYRPFTAEQPVHVIFTNRNGDRGAAVSPIGEQLV